MQALGRSPVHPNTYTPGWDTFVFGIPLVAMLVFGYFRLDEIFVDRKQPAPSIRRQRPTDMARIRHILEAIPESEPAPQRPASKLENIPMPVYRFEVKGGSMRTDPDGRPWDK